ncbi:hypothetical protein K492DRAFT_170203 [Lichtheimia hyalospora FSU 10163]|nr:hypothetical protein K492DRAFT_170203 [Lichtheimia hyalospora FSU 10163]
MERSIDECFKLGKEYIFRWTEKEKKEIYNALKDIRDYLKELPLTLSFQGIDNKRVWRKSCWVLSPGIGKDFCRTESEIKNCDGDLTDGKNGLLALKKLDTQLHYLKKLIDKSLEITAREVGIDDYIFSKCTVRYRIAQYIENGKEPGGIGLHPDGNVLSSLITNSPGLKVYELDGNIRDINHDGTILMGGSILYRWSNKIYKPPIHNVNVDCNQEKTSIIAFLNFKDNDEIPRNIEKHGVNKEKFINYINRFKENDITKGGDLKDLWTNIEKNYNIKLVDYHS